MRPSLSTAAASADTVISVSGLTMSYGDVQVLHGVDIDIHRGEVCAVVGPNGAGKTTTVEILEGYRRRTGGDVSVLGVDPSRPTRAWRGHIGIVLQTCAVPPDLTVRELVERFANYYPAPRPVGETLDLVGLADCHSRRAGSLSGGQQRRLDVAMALVGDPELLFLDEPTTGFDPAARHQAWAVIARLGELGKTVLLTTHYMEEAEALADRVIVIVDGHVVADATPGTLGGRADAAATIRFALPVGVVVESVPVSSPCRTTLNERGVVEILGAGQVDLCRLLDWAKDGDLSLAGLTVERPNLEDVYLELTGGVS